MTNLDYLEQNSWADILHEEEISGAHTLRELYEAQVSEVPFLVEDLIPQTGITILGGDSDTGKGMIAKQLINCIISGEDSFLNQQLNTRYNSAIYISTEENFNSCAFRVQRQLNSIGETDTQILDNGLYIITHEKLTSLLDSLLSKKKADCVVIDPLGNLFNNDSKSMVHARRFFKPYRELELKHDTCFLFIHHTNKGARYRAPNKDDLSGSHAITAVPRQVLLLKRMSGNPSARELNIVKGNDVSDEVKERTWRLRFGEDFNFVVDNSISATVAGSASDAITDEMVEHARDLLEDGNTYREIARSMLDRFEIDRDHNFWYRVLNDS